jgi:hypothetical protein
MARSKLISESGLFSMMLKDARSSWSFVVLASKSECESESGEKRSGSEMGLLAPTLTPALFSAPLAAESCNQALQLLHEQRCRYQCCNLTIPIYMRNERLDNGNINILKKLQ